MAKEKHVSATPATDWLKAHKVNFKLHTYDFVPHGGTTQGAKELGIDNHVMIKTLIMEDENAEPLVSSIFLASAPSWIVGISNFPCLA